MTTNTTALIGSQWFLNLLSNQAFCQTKPGQTGLPRPGLTEDPRTTDLECENAQSARG